MNRVYSWFGCLYRGPLLCLLTAAAFISCGKQAEEPAEVIRPVRYEQVFATGGNRVRAFTGTAQAALQSNLSFKVPGTVKTIFVKVGDEVRAGQRIAALETEDFQLQMQQAEASLQQAEAQQRNAQASYDRVRRLYENQNASRNDLDAARAQSESATASVIAAQKQFELAKRRLAYAVLEAPAEGSIAAIGVDVGENTSPGAMIAVLSSQGQMEVETGVPEVLIGGIARGDKADVVFDALSNESFSAVVTEVGVSLSGRASTYPVTVRLNRVDERLRPGMAAEVAFRFDRSGDRVRYLVPTVAVGADQEGNYVFIVKRGDENIGTVQKRRVQTGEISSQGIEIISGVVDGELVVTAGVRRLHDGQTVKVL